MDAPEYELFNRMFDGLDDDEILAIIPATTLLDLPMFRAWFYLIYTPNWLSVEDETNVKAWKGVMFAMPISTTAFETWLWGKAYDTVESALVELHTCDTCGGDTRHGGRHGVQVDADFFACYPDDDSRDDEHEDMRHLRRFGH